MLPANIEYILNKISSQTVKTICVLAAVFLFVETIFSQNVQYSIGTEDKALRGNSTINPATLGMELKIPLQSYAGRAGTSLPIVLFYSSKVWRMDYGGYVIEGPVGEPYDQYSWATATYGDYENRISWTSSLDFPGVVYTGSPEYYDASGFPCGIECIDDNPFYVRRLRIKMPDGSTHEFRADDKVYSTSQQPQLPLTYYSVDSSRMRYVDEGNGQATLYLPDGSRYLMGQGVFIDRHGNKLVRQTNSWIDTLGRSIPVPSLIPPQSSSDTSYTLPGFDGGSSTYTFRWRAMSTIRSDPTNQPLAPIGFRNPYDNTICGGLFWNSGGNTRVGPVDSACTGFDTIVLSEIELPNGAKYKFLYNQYGEITKIIYPTGAYERFRYEQVDALDPLNEPYAQINRGVRERWISPDGNSQNELHWQYISSSGSSYYSVVTTAPDGTKTERVLIKGRGPTQVYGFDDARVGMPKEQVFKSSSNQILRRTLFDFAWTGAQSGGHSTATRDARLIKQVEIIFEGNLAIAKTTTFSHDQYLNVISSTEYDFVTGDRSWGESATVSSISTGTAQRTTETAYETDSNYISRQLLSLPVMTVVKQGDGNGTIMAKTQIWYDESGYSLSSTGTMPSGAANSWVDPVTELGSTLGSKRGLLTTVRSYSDISGNQYVEAHGFYDQYGNVLRLLQSS